MFLTLREFLKLRGKQKNPVIVHYNEKQWATLTRDLKPVNKTPPKTGLQMILTTLPGLPGGLVEFRCPDGGPITGAEGQARCGGKPGVDFPEPGTRPPEFEGICITKNDTKGRTQCFGFCKSGSCRKTAYAGKSTRLGLPTPLIIVCRC